MATAFVHSDIFDDEPPRTYLSKCRFYAGPLRDMPEAEARRLTEELIDYWAIGYGMPLPGPEAGFPGVGKAPDDPDTYRALYLGKNYLLSLLERKPRRQKRAFEEMMAHMQKVHGDGVRKVEEALERQAQRRLREARELERLPEPKAVYFIGDADGPIKIGVARNPKNRLKNLRTSNPAKLELLAVTTGGEAVERDYHQRFAAHRLQGEWFARHPDILAEITALNAYKKEAE